MPFTFSHPAIVLPFVKAKSESISLSALIVASMIPDFQYFISMKLNGRFSHSLEGIFLFDLPASVLMLFIFHGLVKKPLIDNLPAYFNVRLQQLKSFNFREYVKNHPLGFIICILIGTISHIVWDGFTHDDGLFSEMIPALLSKVIIQGLPELSLYRYLQHLSSLIGAIIILVVFHNMPVSTNLTKPDLKFWTALTFFFTVTLVIRISFGVEYYGDMIVILISSGLFGLVCASAITRLKWNRT